MTRLEKFITVFNCNPRTIRNEDPLPGDLGPAELFMGFEPDWWEKDYVERPGEFASVYKRLTDMKAAEEAWRFAHDCNLRRTPDIAAWLDQETRYPHGMTYDEAVRSFEAFKENKRMSCGLVLWGHEMPQSCDACPCYCIDYDECNISDCEVIKYDRRPEGCPLEVVKKEDLKK